MKCRELHSAIREIMRLAENGNLDSTQRATLKKIRRELREMEHSGTLSKRRVLRVIQLTSEVLADQLQEREGR